MYRDHSYHATPTYASHLAHLASSPHAIVAEDRTVQFPFVAGSGSHEKTEEDLKNQLRKREEATKRLKEQAARQRQEKVRGFESASRGGSQVSRQVACHA